MKKLDEIIREFYIEDLGLTQLDERYPRFLSIGINGIKELNFDLKNIVKSVVLTVNDNDTVNLPSDYLDYLVIGTSRGGLISSLGLNNNIIPRELDTCGDIIISDVSSDDTVSGNFSHNQSSFTLDGQLAGRRYGLGGGDNANGSYAIHKSEGYISLNGFSGGTIILKYLASAEAIDGNFMIDEFFTEFVKGWLMYVYTRSQRSYRLGDKQFYEARMKRTRKIAEKRKYRVNMNELTAAINSGYRSSPGL